MFEVNGGIITNPQSLEVNAVHHCNLACRGCSHLSPVLPRKVLDPVELESSLSVLARFYHAAKCKIVGGEPLMHPQLPEVLRAIRRSGVVDKIQVCTNGLLLPRMPLMFWELVDEVCVSNYPGRSLEMATYPSLNALSREHGVDFQVEFFDYFRVAYSEIGTHSEPLVRRIYNTCKMVHLWHCHTVYEGYFFKCPQSVFIDRVLQPGVASWMQHGIAIRDTNEFQGALLDYLNSPHPLGACRHCLAMTGRRIPHEQISRSDWRRPQDVRTEELVDLEFLTQLEDDIEADEGCVRSTCPMPPTESTQP